MAIQPTSTTSTTATTGTTAASAPKSLGKDDFLKLLVGQLQNQDPMNPTSSDFMGQMTQFTMLEQITNMAQANDKLAKSAAVNGSLALLGHTVTYVDEAGRVGSGKVENVAVRDGAPSLTVGGRSGIDPSAVSEIR